MAFPTGWNSKHKLTIDRTKVSGSSNLTNFPVYLSGDNFLPDVFTKAAARREINANWLLNDANLQGYWRLEADGTDSSPNGYNLAGTTRGAVAGKFGNGLDFERDSFDYISIADASCPNLEISGSQTWSVWIKPESLPSVGTFTVMGKRSNFGSSKAVQISYGAEHKPVFWVLGLSTSSVILDTVMSVGNWYHIVGRYDSTAGTLSVFVNGAKNSVATSGSKNDTDGDFVIGGQAESGEYFDGIIDDVAIFNRALSDYEVKALYYGTADLRFSSDFSGSTELASEVVFFDPDNSLAEVHVKVPTVSYNTDTDFYVWYEASTEAPYAPNATYGSQAVWSDYQGVWHFEEYPSVTAPQIKDSTANGNNGTSSGSMTSSDLVSGKIGKALDFDGTDDYIDCGSGASLQLDGNSFTVSMWIKLGQINRFNYPLAKGGSLAGNQWLIIGIRNTNNWTVAFWANDLNVAGSPSVETWYHLVATYDTTTNSRKLYLNGSLIGSDTSTSDLTNTNSYSLRIGNYYSDYFLGSVDEVHILNTVHSADWIATEYANQNSPSTFVTESVVTTVVLNSYKSLLGVGR